MKALRYHGKRRVSVDSVPDPVILAPTDAIVRVTTTAICGSDLHLYNGYIPTVEHGDIFGHEFMGVVVEIGSAVRTVAPGDRVVIPFTIACGRCSRCRAGTTSLCDNSNPNAWMGDIVAGFTPSGLYGYSHAFGGYPGGQAELVRIVFADANAFRVPAELDDEAVLFLTDILPTGYQAAEQCGIQPGDVVAVWGCGPVGLFAIQSALLLGAERVIAIDRLPYRLERARALGADALNFDELDVVETLKDRTGGRGPDHVIDAVGMEAHSVAPDAMLDRAKQSVRLTMDRAHVLRQAVYACGKGGTVSVPGVYIGAVDLFPMGAAMAKSLQIRTGQTHVHRYLQPLLDRIVAGEIAPQHVISHRMRLDDAPAAYEMFTHKTDGCEKVVLRP